MGPTSHDLVTLEAYAAMSESDDEHVTELVQGAVVREPRPGRRHGRLQVRLGHLLQAWADRHGRAEVTAESGYILADEPATVRGPDLAVVVDPPAEVPSPGGWVRGAPDVAIEILSPGDTSMAIRRKTLDYLEAGAAAVWVVDPAAQAVTIYRPDGSARVLRGDDPLTSEDVLPGFSVPLSRLFRP